MSKSPDEQKKPSEKNDKAPPSLERLKIYIGFAKFFTALLFGTVLTSVLTWIINFKEVAIKERESKLQLQLNEREELANYFRYTMEGDVYDRLKLSVFFSNVLTDEDARDLWKQYHKEQEELLEEYLQSSISLQAIEDSSDDTLTNIESEIRINFQNTKLEQLLNPISLEIRQEDTTNTNTTTTSDTSYKFNLDLLEETILEEGTLTWNEATKDGQRIPPSQEVESNIIRLAAELEKMQKELFPGNQLVITSWYRDPVTNAAVGGPPRSQHILGHAATFYIKDRSLAEVFKEVDEYWDYGLGDGTSQGFIHVDLRPERIRFSY